MRIQRLMFLPANIIHWSQASDSGCNNTTGDCIRNKKTHQCIAVLLPEQEVVCLRYVAFAARCRG